MRCPKCQTEVSAKAKFCQDCGQKIKETAEEIEERITGSLKRPAWATELPKAPTEIRKKLEKAKDDLAGARKLVTVMFADISGFTTLCEKLDPEQVTELMNKYFGRLGQVVYEFEGYIDKFIGDCIMALFGAPIAHENDPELAVRCALKLLAELEALNQENHHKLGIRIGINSGLVVAGGVGTDLKFQFTVMGDTVNTAQRLQSSAGLNQIVVGRSVAKNCQHLFEFESLSGLKLKGKEEAVEAFLVKGFKKRQFAASKSIRESQNKLTGRKDELTKAIHAIENLRNGVSQHFAFIGEPGIGKSRLKLETRTYCQTKGIQWFETKGVSSKSETPYYCVKNLLQQILQDHIFINPKTHKPELASLENFGLDKITQVFLEDLLQLQRDGSQSLQMEANQKKKATFVAVKALLDGVSKKGFTAYFIDDLQFVDSMSRELLTYLINFKNSKWLMASAFRNDFDYSWLTTDSLFQIEIHRLTNEEAIQLSENLLQLKPLPKLIEKTLIERCAGNPLYIEETIKALTDSGKIVRKDEQWVLPESLEELQIPDTIHGIISSRIDRLYQTDREVLEYAAVMGRQFTDKLLARAMQKEDGLHESLQFLRKKELVFEIGIKNDQIEYSFNHLLTQEVVYNSILKKRRKQLHKQVGEAIEELISQKQISDVYTYLPILANHYLEAADCQEKAASYLFKSAKQMVNAFHHDGAIRYFLKAAEIFKSIPNKKRELASTYSELADEYVLTGQVVKADEVLKLAVEEVKTLKDDAFIAKALRRIADNARKQNQKDKANKFLEGALQYAAKAKDVEAEAEIHKSRGNLLKANREFPEALQCFENALHLARKLQNAKLVAEILNDCSTVLISLKNLDAAEKTLIEARQIAKADGERPIEIAALLNLGAIDFMRSANENALKKFSEAADEAAKIGDFVNRMNGNYNLGIVEINFKRFEKAKTHLEESHRLACQFGSDLERLSNAVFLKFSSLCLGTDAKAEDEMKMLFAEIEKIQHWSLLVEGQTLYAKFLIEKNRKQEARESLEKLLAKLKSMNHSGLAQRAEELLKATA